MRKNTQDVYKAWKNGQHKDGQSISTDGHTIKSYQTTILHRDEDANAAILNARKYSVTTARQQSDLRRLLSQDGIKTIEIS